GRHEQAESMARYGLGVARSLGATSEDPNVIYLLHNLGATYLAENRYQEARQILEGALTAAERSLGPNHHKLGQICSDLAWCYLDLAEWQKAMEMLKRGLNINVETLGPDHVETARNYHRLGWLALHDGKPVDAESYLLRALEVSE